MTSLFSKAWASELSLPPFGARGSYLKSGGAQLKTAGSYAEALGTVRRAC